MLQVAAEVLEDAGRLREGAVRGVSLVDRLEVEEQQLLDGAVLGGEDVADDGGEERRQGLAVGEEREGTLHGLGLGGDVAALETRLDLVRRGGGALVQVDQERAEAVHGDRRDLPCMHQRRRWIGIWERRLIVCAKNLPSVLRFWYVTFVSP